MRGVQASDFDFQLPLELIAQRPLPERAASRLLVLDPSTESGQGGSVAVTDALIRSFPRFVEAGDLLVFNDTRVIPARLHGRKSSGGTVEMLLERPLEGVEALLHMRASKPLRSGEVVLTAGGEIIVVGRDEDLFHVRLPAPAVEFFVTYGEVPLPPYIERTPDADDLERYQSVLARVPGAVAAPTASLHFDEALLAVLEARGVKRTIITLHVGAGTFQPLRSDRIGDHVMHAEWAEVPAAACDAINAARAAGHRVIAIGTTVVRALESAALVIEGTIAPWTGMTRIFITPGFHWRTVDALLTNFHLPRSTLLMLVSSFVGRDTVLSAYAHAVAQRYRFFSYGDAMFITRRIGA